MKSASMELDPPFTELIPAIPIADQDVMLSVSSPSDTKVETQDDELPPVYQFPIVRTVIASFYEAGRHPALPFPDSMDD